MRIKAVIVKVGLWGLSKKDLRDAGRDAILSTGLFWHANLKKHHFQLYAYGRYGYKHRHWRYEDRKDKQHPEAQGRPLVFTGTTERLAMAQNKVAATARSWESFHADVITNAPVLNYQKRADELTRTTAPEVVQLGNHFAREFTRRFLAIAETRQGSMPVTRVGVA